VPADKAANQTMLRYWSVKNAYNKPVLLTEFGWPGSSGADQVSQANIVTGEKCGIANPKNQISSNQAVIDYCAANKLPCALFSSFNELWKGSNANDINAYWGFCSSYSPYTCSNVPTGFSGSSSAVIQPTNGPNARSSASYALISVALIIIATAFVVSTGAV
jgi:hypothetical protein